MCFIIMRFNNLVQILSPHLLPEQIQHGKTQKRKQQKREESNGVGRRNLQEMPE